MGKFFRACSNAMFNDYHPMFPLFMQLPWDVDLLPPIGLCINKDNGLSSPPKANKEEENDDDDDPNPWPYWDVED